MSPALLERNALKVPDPTQECFADLARTLNAVPDLREAARAFLFAADASIGWDACWIGLCSSSQNSVSSLLAFNVHQGERVETTPAPPDEPLRVCINQFIEKGAQLIHFDPLDATAWGVSFMGPPPQSAASLLSTPVRVGSRPIGLVVLQGGTPRAYSTAELNLLNGLADISATAFVRFLAEARLRRTEELYRRAIGGAGAAPYAYDYRTRSYEFMGEEIQKLTGYAPNEISGSLWVRITQESIMAGDAQGLPKAEAARKVISGELNNWRCDMRILTREGKVRWLSDISVQNTDDHGQVTGSMGILQDITERKQAEICAVALSRLGQDLLGASSPEAVARKLSEVAAELFPWHAYEFAEYNSSEQSITPVLTSHLIGGKRTETCCSGEKLPPGTAARRVIAHGPELIPPGQGEPIEAVNSGEKFYAYASGMRVPIRLRGEVTGLVSLYSNATQAYTAYDLRNFQALADYCGNALERMASDQALRHSESQFRLVWESSTDGMRLASEDGIILRVNDAFCRLVQKSRSELEGRPLCSTYAEKKAAQVMDDYRNHIHSGKIQQHAERMVELWNGRIAWFDVSHSLLKVPGTPPQMLTTFRDITERKRAETELERLHRQLMDASRQAGMAEVATSVLHNVGNVLNSVNVSTSLVCDRLAKSRISNLPKAMSLVESHKTDLARFFAEDPKGKQLPAYLQSLAEHIADEHEEVVAELQSLGSNIEHIKEIVAMQQNYARVIGLIESLPAASLVEDALCLNTGALERHKIKLVRDFRDVPPVIVEKHKVLQILVNLIRNAKYALDEGGPEDKILTLRIRPSGGNATAISVSDNGIGIAPQNLTRVFEHGFTTRKEGHGFGLHTSALAAKELNGSLQVESAGLGAGATFTLILPCANT